VKNRFFLTINFLAVLVASLVGIGVAHGQSAGLAVGEVTLHIGQAVVVSSSQASEVVRRGTLIHAGDRIETAEGGHVHIRFIDGALVSLRPTSRLVVEDYQYNPQQVKQSLVRFRLDKGVTRAISGAAAEGAKDRFRLNTPLVAIGVRGTDFVVSSQFNQTIATVNQGAIVMTPFGDGCSPQALGPCGSAFTRLLTAEMVNTRMEFRNTLAQPELKPFNGLKPPDMSVALADPRPPEDPAATSREISRQARTPAAGDDVVTAALVQSAVKSASDASMAVAQPQVPPAPIVVTPVVVPPVVVAPVVVPPVVVAPVVVPPVVVVPVVVAPVVVPAPVVVVPAPVPLPPPQLAWGRWHSTALDATDFASSRSEAGQGRKATVGDNDFILYRNPSGAAVAPTGVANFNLQQAHARFTSPSGALLPAQVQSGSLMINFGTSAYQTGLNVTSAATGNVGLQASGYINGDGFFSSRSATQVVAGAVANDGKSAGYLFEKAAAGGILSGITLWSR
jgi:hypothetical protein